MALFVIADTHLSESTEKPMDIFGSRWANWTEKLCENWKSTVTDSDTVVIPGDISWAMTLEEAKNDFLLLESLPGNKIIGKGNHDYWWNTLRKDEEFFKKEGICSIRHLYNNSHLVDDTVICGCRG
jgi:predicted phosphohydrolase